MSDKVTMPADATIELTAEELALMKRAAFEDGAQYLRERTYEAYIRPSAMDPVRAEARRRYPIRRRVPRVVEDSTKREYRAVDGAIQVFSFMGAQWLPMGRLNAPLPTTERIRMWAALLDNPHEEVVE